MQPLPGVARREMFQSNTCGALSAGSIQEKKVTNPGVPPTVPSQWTVRPSLSPYGGGSSTSSLAPPITLGGPMRGHLLSDQTADRMGPSPSLGVLPPHTPQITWKSIRQPRDFHWDNPSEVAAAQGASTPRQRQGSTPRRRTSSTNAVQPTRAMPSASLPTPALSFPSAKNGTTVGDFSHISLRPNPSLNPALFTHFELARPLNPQLDIGGIALEKPESNHERAGDDVKFSELCMLESLGSGEFGHVFRGTWRGQEVAIKQLYWDGNCKTDALEELRREVASFRNLKHPRLVRFIGACFEPPHLCMLTEYMSYGSLYHALHVTKLKFPFRNACNMSLQLAEGVTFLHSQLPMVVHRDLKSLNVVLDMHFNIKICDFGLTEIMERTHMTKKNNGGSPRYMAPELFDKKSKITEKIDVWAMGCILAEIFGGKIPYDGVVDLPDLTRTILVFKKLPRIPQNENCPLAVQKVIADCLTYDGECRPRSKDIFDRLRDVKKSHQPSN